MPTPRINRIKPKSHPDRLVQGYGPAMSQLNATQRKFVEALYAHPGTPKYQALILSGYKSKGGPEPERQKASAKAMAHKFMRNPLVLDAIKEAGVKEYQGKLPAIIGALDQIVHNPKHKDHAKVLLDAMDRVGMPAVQETKTTITHDISAFEVISRIKALAAKLEIADEEGRINDTRLTLLGRAQALTVLPEGQAQALTVLPEGQAQALTVLPEAQVVDAEIVSVEVVGD